MLPLQGPGFPASSDALREALLAGFTHLGLAPREVIATGGAFPAVETLRIDLSGLSAGLQPPMVKPGAPLSGEVQAGEFAFLAQPLVIDGSPVQLELRARKATLREHAAEGIDRVLVLRSGEGNVNLEIGRDDLQRLALAAAKAAAKQHGADVADLTLDLNAIDPRTVELRSDVTAKFGFLKATLTVTGRATLDDQLQLRLSNLDVTGSGMAAGVATGFIRPQLEKVERKPISLAALPLGDLKLRDVRISTGDRIRLEAAFGA